MSWDHEQKVWESWVLKRSMYVCVSQGGSASGVNELWRWLQNNNHEKTSVQTIHASKTHTHTHTQLKNKCPYQCVCVCPFFAIVPCLLAYNFPNTVYFQFQFLNRKQIYTKRTTMWHRVYQESFMTRDVSPYFFDSVGLQSRFHCWRSMIRTRMQRNRLEKFRSCQDSKNTCFRFEGFLLQSDVTPSAIGYFSRLTNEQSPYPEFCSSRMC